MAANGWEDFDIDDIEDTTNKVGILPSHSPSLSVQPSSQHVPQRSISSPISKNGTRPPHSHKGNEENESESPFEILDFTSATDWEHFIAHIESTLRSWDIRNTTAVELDSKPIALNGRPFVLQYRNLAQPGYLKVSLKEQMADFSLDFVANPIQAWFGTSEFLIMVPLDKAVMGPSTSSQLLSSLAIAMTNSGW